MADLVEIKKEQVVCTSLDVAEKFGKRHDSVVRNIEKLIIDSPQKCGQLFSKSNYKDTSGKSNKMYYMNRDGFSLLVMGFNGKKALEWKLKYIEAFNSMEKLLTEKQTQTWIETRKQSKLTRNAEMDVVKKFVEYAEENGSTNANKYYMTFSKLANKMANIASGERDNATTFQLNSLTFIESIILHTIECQMALGTEYHEIYQKCKRAIDDFKELTDYESLQMSSDTKVEMSTDK